MSDTDVRWMRHALSLAKQGEGGVEPNPMVGCVLVRDGQAIGQGWHRRCGGPHAEIDALGGRDPAQQIDAAGATAYVTLEPCSHFGRTPPCVDALIAAQVSRVVVAIEDPFPKVQGRGLQRLREAGIQVESGVMAPEARQLMAPYLMRVTNGRPWMIAKWAMTLDGKIATSSGSSQWISNETSRAKVHALRSRVDAVMVGSATALVDDPLLTARGANAELLPKQPVRVVCDRRLRLPPNSALAQSASTSPVIIATCDEVDESRAAALIDTGCEVLRLPASEYLAALLQDLGSRQMTNVLLEGGATLAGALLDAQLVDEVWAFIAPKIVGGEQAPTPLGGSGVMRMADALPLQHLEVETSDGDILVRGRLNWPQATR